MFSPRSLPQCADAPLASQLLTAALLMFAAPLHAAEITATATPHGVAVKIDGALFTEYLIRSGAKPILWPILGPTGEPMTRAYPMGEPPAGTKETKDHVHQRLVLVHARQRQRSEFLGRRRETRHHRASRSSRRSPAEARPFSSPRTTGWTRRA